MNETAAALRSTEPRVYLDYTQAELDAAYDQTVYEPNIQQLRDRWASASERTRARIGQPERHAYGPSTIEALDIFHTAASAASPAPIFVFIHGGAWRAGLAKTYAAPAEMFVRAGAHYIVPDFVSVQDADGSLFPMAEQVCRAIAWVYRNAASFGGDSNRLYLGGHSSGAHLAAVALTTHWLGKFDLPANVIKGGMVSSGMYDLHPVRLSHRSSYVSFTDEMVQALSPQRHIARLSAPLIVAYGTRETPEFQRQARDFATAVGEAGKPVDLLVGSDYAHLELPETLCNPHGLLGAAVLDQMGLAASQPQTADARNSARRTRTIAATVALSSIHKSYGITVMEQDTLPQPTTSAATRETEPEVQAGILSGDTNPETPTAIETDQRDTHSFGRLALWIGAGALLGYGASRLWRR
ncbi:MAG: alpha/beta hydrolase [Alphaproteobacteria bacterium]|nr:alpha/beta hydrolase [Alphaproteobacteria bacterium]